MSHILELKDIEKSFGENKVLDSCSLGVKEGEVIGLAGPNGAGKTTLVDVISGVKQQDSGDIIFKDSLINQKPTHERTLNGIVRTFQIARPFDSLTVRENLMVAKNGQTGENPKNLIRHSKVRSEEQGLQDKVDQLLSQFDLEELADEYAGSLSGGQKRIMELARATMLEPDLVVLDEPFTSVSPTITDEMIIYIQKLQKQGISFLIIEHDLQKLDEVAENIKFMAEGEIIAEGSLDELKQNDEVVERFLGGHS